MKTHLNLATSDLDRTVSFYSILLDAKPAKKLRDYALFITEQPALELALDLRDVVVSPSDDVHYGICVETSEEVDRAIDRLTLAGLVASIEREETCCYANATKVWATDPDGRHWEVYTVHKEADTALSCCSGALPAVPPPKWSAPRCRSQASIGSGRQPLHAPMAAMRNLRLLTAILALMASVGNPRPASAGNVPGRDLLGTWNCTYMAGGHATTYSATFAYAMGGIWMHEADSSHGAAQGEAFFTYDTKSKTWTAVFVGSDRSATIFRAVGPSTTHIVYQSVYPDRSMTETFEWPAPRKYTLHFAQVVNGKTVRSNDACTKA